MLRKLALNFAVNSGKLMMQAVTSPFDFDLVLYNFKFFGYFCSFQIAGFFFLINNNILLDFIF